LVGLNEACFLIAILRRAARGEARSSQGWGMRLASRIASHYKAWAAAVIFNDRSGPSDWFFRANAALNLDYS